LESRYSFLLLDNWLYSVIIKLTVFYRFGDDQDERILSKQIVESAVPYPENLWKNKSPESKKFVMGILNK